MINDKLTSFERRNILNSIGFDIRKTSGQINNIKNIDYDDSNGDLCINLDTGMVRDFGDSNYNGDIVHLVSKILKKDFYMTVKHMEKITKKKLLDGNKQAEILYGEPSGESKPEKIKEKKKEEESIEFWNNNNKNRLKKCISVLEKRGIIDPLKYIMDYDGIDKETLLEYNCGIYGFKDYEFGLTNYSYNNDVYFSIPYHTGCMLYRRSEDGKDVRNIKGSKPKHSFFGIKKDMKKSLILFIMKSPRECMSFNMMMKGLNINIIGLTSGEEVTEITDNQKEQIISLIKKNKSTIYTITDCDNPDAYEKSLVFGKVLNESIDSIIVKTVNIHRYFEGKRKDFTDIIQHSMKKGFWKKNDIGVYDPDDKSHRTLMKAIQEAQAIK